MNRQCRRVSRRASGERAKKASSAPLAIVWLLPRQEADAPFPLDGGVWSALRHAQRGAALYSSQTARAAGRKALKPQPIHQANLVVWHPTFRVPLNFVAVAEKEITAACERFNLSQDA